MSLVRPCNSQSYGKIYDWMHKYYPFLDYNTSNSPIASGIQRFTAAFAWFLLLLSPAPFVPTGYERPEL